MGVGMKRSKRWIPVLLAASLALWNVQAMAAMSQVQMGAACGAEQAAAAASVTKQAQNAQQVANNMVQNPAPAATQACLQTDFTNFDMGFSLTSLSGLLSSIGQQIVSQACAAMSASINATVNGPTMAFNGQVSQLTALPSNLGGALSSQVSSQISQVGGSAQQIVNQPVYSAQAQGSSATGSVFSHLSSYVSNLFH